VNAASRRAAGRLVGGGPGPRTPGISAPSVGPDHPGVLEGTVFTVRVDVPGIPTACCREEAVR
jgi:hypothetical protein